MPRSRTLSRALVAGLAIAAIAAPTALARPIQDPPTKAPAVDLRMPDTKDAAAQSQQRSDTDGVQTSSLAGTTSPPAVYWAYDYQAQDPKTAPPSVVSTKPAPAPATDGGGSDTPWATIGIALAAALLGATGGAAVASRTRRSGAAA